MALNDFCSRHLPYCIQRLPDGTYVVLNREYKPVGFADDHYVYEEYPIGAKFKGLTARIAEQVSWNRSQETDKIYLYNDGCVPTAGKHHMAAYLDRLATLAKLQIKD